jgi:hypothetical protein
MLGGIHLCSVWMLGVVDLLASWRTKLFKKFKIAMVILAREDKF